MAIYLLFFQDLLPAVKIVYETRLMPETERIHEQSKIHIKEINALVFPTNTHK